ncbi:MAG: T9SS type A sorting domain-containing protein [Parafilimonas sp.]
MRKYLFPVLIAFLFTINYCSAQSTFKDSIVVKGHVRITEARVFKNNDYFINWSIVSKNIETDQFTRVDGNGNIVWSKNYSLPSANYGKSVTTSDNGFIYVVHNSNSISVFKYAENGNLQWSKKYQFSEPYDILEQKIIESAEGGYYVHCNTGINLDTYLAKKIVMRLNSNGDIVWSSSYDINGLDLDNLSYPQMDVMCEAPNGGIIVSQKDASCRKDNCDIVSFVWYNNKGEFKKKIIYDKKGVYNSDELAPDLLATDGTSLYTVMGYYLNGQNYIINKIDLSVSTAKATVLPTSFQNLAHYLQNKNISAFTGLGYKSNNGGSSADTDSCLVFNSDGGYATITPIQISSTVNAIVIKQYDKHGYTCPDFIEPFDTSSHPTQISFGVSGVEAKSAGTMTAMPDTLTLTSNNLNVTILCQGEGSQNATSINNAVSSNLPVNKNSVYPNPVKDILHIYALQTTTISVTNQAGKTMFTKQVSGKTDINVSTLDAGMYFVKFYNTGKVEKVIVIK